MIHGIDDLLVSQVAPEENWIENGLPASLAPGGIAFVDGGDVAHNDFLTSAWCGAPLRDIFARIGAG